MSETITFRPSEKALQKIKEAMTEKNLNRNEAVNYLLEQQFQLGQTPKHAEITSTGIILHCPLRSCPVKDYDSIVARPNFTMVDTSVCKTCHRYLARTCREWENIESNNRLAKDGFKGFHEILLP